VGHVACMGEKSVQDFGGKVRRRETTRKTEALMGFWDQNGSSGDWLRMCVEWIKLALDRYRCRAVVIIVYIQTVKLIKLCF
jgi:hypothetical protein